MGSCLACSCVTFDWPDLRKWGQLGFKVCRNCGLGEFEQKPTESDLLEYYESVYSHYLEASIRELDLQAQGLNDSARQFASSLEQFAVQQDPNSGILDFGSSFPTFAIALAEVGISAQVVEPNEKARQYGKSRGISAYKNIDEVPATPIFSAVRMCHSIEHLRNPEFVIAQLHDRLLPNGLLYVDCPNFDSTVARLYEENWEWFAYPDHLFYFTPLALCYFLQKCGFDVVFLETTGGSSGLPQSQKPESSDRNSAWLDKLLKAPNLRVIARKSEGGN